MPRVVLGLNRDDTCGLMRRLFAVLGWAAATLSLTYVANAAVELVDLQVFPRGAKIEVLSRALPETITATTTVGEVSTTNPENGSTSAIPTIDSPTEIPTTTVPVASTTTVPVASTTTVPVASTTTGPVASTTTGPVASTTTGPVASTTTGPVASTTSSASVVTTEAPPSPTIPSPPTTQEPVTASGFSRLMFMDVGTVELRTGSSYRARLVAGGVGPYAWSVVSGSLPAGLTLTREGYYEGTISASGAHSATVLVSDSTGETATGEVSFFSREFRIVSARGGSVTVVLTGDSVEFFSALQNEEFQSAQILRRGPIVVEVVFLPQEGEEVSWVRCEVGVEVSCSGN